MPLAPGDVGRRGKPALTGAPPAASFLAHVEDARQCLGAVFRYGPSAGHPRAVILARDPVHLGALRADEFNSVLPPGGLNNAQPIVRSCVPRVRHRELHVVRTRRAQFQAVLAANRAIRDHHHEGVHVRHLGLFKLFDIRLIPVLLDLGGDLLVLLVKLGEPRRVEIRSRRVGRLIGYGVQTASQKIRLVDLPGMDGALVLALGIVGGAESGWAGKQQRQEAQQKVGPICAHAHYLATARSSEPVTIQSMVKPMPPKTGSSRFATLPPPIPINSAPTADPDVMMPADAKVRLAFQPRTVSASSASTVYGMRSRKFRPTACEIPSHPYLCRTAPLKV